MYLFPAWSLEAAWNYLDQKTKSTPKVKYYNLFKQAASELNCRELDKERDEDALGFWALKGTKIWLAESSGWAAGKQTISPREKMQTEAHCGVKRTPGPPILAAWLPEQTAPNLHNIESQMGYTEWIHRQEASIPACCRNRPGLDLSLLSSDKLEAGTDPKIQNKMAFNCD